MNYCLLAAAVLSFLWAGVHLFTGGKYIARPLLSTKELHRVVIYTQYYCWHLVTLKIFAMGAAFLYSAVYYTSDTRALSLFAVGLALGFAVLGIVMVPMVQQSYKDMPQGWMFVPVVILGILGVMQV